MFRGLPLFILALAATVSGEKKYQPSDLTEEKAKEVVICLGKIICEAREPVSLREIERAAMPETQVEGRLWMKICYNTTEPSATDEWFNSLPDCICPLPKPIRMEKFSDFCTMVGNYYRENNCEQDEETPICEGIQAALAAAERVMKEYEDRGICVPASKSIKDGAEKTQSYAPGMG